MIFTFHSWTSLPLITPYHRTHNLTYTLLFTNYFYRSSHEYFLLGSICLICFRWWSSFIYQTANIIIYTLIPIEFYSIKYHIFHWTVFEYDISYILYPTGLGRQICYSCSIFHCHLALISHFPLPNSYDKMKISE